jgi:hypothetical protein
MDFAATMVSPLEKAGLLRVEYGGVTILDLQKLRLG